MNARTYQSFGATSKNSWADGQQKMQTVQRSGSPVLFTLGCMWVPEAAQVTKLLQVTKQGTLVDFTCWFSGMEFHFFKKLENSN